MMLYFVAMLAGFVTSATLANGVGSIHCEETFAEGRRILAFERGDFRLVESEEKVNTENNVYWRQELIVLSKESICGVPIIFSECDVKDDTIGETQTLEITCRDQNETLYANMMLTLNKDGQSWDLTRSCGITISRLFRTKRFEDCRISR